MKYCKVRSDFARGESKGKCVIKKKMAKKSTMGGETYIGGGKM